MSDYNEGENSCVRCLRNSPVASLLGFIIVLIGGGAFGGSIIVARRYLINMLENPDLFCYMDYAIYGLIGLVGFFSLLAYLICTLSSGSNAKRCFESSRKSICGRCCNMTLIICLAFGVLLWISIACLISYPLVSISLLRYRNQGPARLSISGLADTVLDRQRRMAKLHRPNFQTNDDPMRELTNMQPEELPGSNAVSMDILDEPIENVVDQLPNISDFEPVDPVKLTPTNVENAAKDQLNAFEQPIINRQPLDTAENMVKKGLPLAEAAKRFFICLPWVLDLSYYGLYDKNGLPMTISSTKFDLEICNVFICICIALAGVFLMVLGHLQILICTAMNFARMQEPRYYDISDAGEEGVALQQ